MIWSSTFSEKETSADFSITVSLHGPVKCDMLERRTMPILTDPITEEKTDTIIVEAETKHCFTNQNMRPISLKKENKEMYNTFME